jgi:lauroyl/myristoyl acyltransferase
MYYVMNAVSRLIQLIPLKWLYKAAGFITKTVFMMWKEQVLSVKFGRPATAAEINEVMKKNFINYGKFTVEFLYINKLVRDAPLPDIRGNGIEEIQKGLVPGKGLIIGTLHFGNWDIAGIAISGHMKGKAQVWAIADDLGGGYNRFIQESRNAYGINIV